MSSKNMALRILVGVLLVAILTSCNASVATPTAAPTVDVQPTLIAVQTQSARTVVANLTQNAPTSTPVTPATPTATQMPTATSTPTVPPLPTATPTATWIPWTLTPTQAAWSCSITSFTPSLNANIASNSDFDATWVLKNTGKEKWLAADIDVRYSSGTKLQKKVDGIDLPNDVATGESVTAAIDMHTPTDLGTYSTTWVVARGDQVICSMSLTVIVK
jgi:hypothetical protein